MASTLSETGTELSLVLKVGANPKALYVHYQAIDSIYPNGEIYSPARLADLVVSQEDGQKLVERVVEWIAEVRNNQSLRSAIPPLAQLPFELVSNLTVSPDGIYYLIEMASLMIHIEWDKLSDEVTIFAGDEFTVPFEAFIYYVDTLVDLVNAILIEKS